jgi:Ubiquitin elongating factor core
MYTGAALSDGPHSSLLGSHFEAQRYLAPALLLLYGDVERTGFYEKLTNRRSIMVVLKHLWTLETHRPAFRGIATVGTNSSTTASASSSSSAASADVAGDTRTHAKAEADVVESMMTTDSQLSFVEMSDDADEEEQMAIAMSLSQASQDTASPPSSAPAPAPAPVEYDSTPDDNYFIRFANGLMNETNSLVSTTMDRLGTLQTIATAPIPALFPCHAIPCYVQNNFLLEGLPASVLLEDRPEAPSLTHTRTRTSLTLSLLSLHAPPLSGEIKKTQVLMVSQEWSQMPQEERTRILERHEGPYTCCCAC